MDRKKWKERKRRWLAVLLPPLATLVIRLLHLTLRYRIHVAEETRRILEEGKPVLLAFWHGRMLILPPVLREGYWKRGHAIWVMVSRHWDGELIARTVKPFRVFSARGSSTRGGREALQELVEKGRMGLTVAITPDGPAGPCYTVQPGVVRIAQLTGLPIVPLTWAACPRWIASSWDRFQIPRPFSRVSVVFDEPIRVAAGEDPDGLEACRACVEKRLGQATDRMEAEAEARAREGRLSARGGWGRGLAFRFEASLRTCLQRFWGSAPSERGAPRRTLAFLLAPLSGLYGLVVRARRSLYRSGVLPARRVGRPVVSVGGLRVGGSGKTPFTVWMARRLRERGARVVVLTRGYGRRKGRGTLLLTGPEAGLADPLEWGDEPLLLAQNLADAAVAVNGDRWRAAKVAGKRFGPDLFLMDDGFQHLRLARDFDIVLLPAQEDLSRAQCLPGGPLREPLSALRDADVVVCISTQRREERRGTGTGSPWWRTFRVDVPVHEARLAPKGLYRLEDQTEVQPKWLAGARIGAFCGIARPASFWETLEGMGLNVIRRRDFPDHHPYSAQDHRNLLSLLADSDRLITTEKDAVKIRRFPWPEGMVLFVRLDLLLEDEPAFWARLESSGVIAKGGDRK